MNQRVVVFASTLLLALIVIIGLSYQTNQQKQELLEKLSSAEQKIENLNHENALQTENQESILSNQEIFDAAYETEDIGQWKKYQNTVMNIAFEYPSAFLVKEARDKIIVIDPSQPRNTDASHAITITKEKGSARDLSVKYIGFNNRIEWNPYSESSRKFTSNVAMIPHFSGDTSRYNTYLFPYGFVDLEQIPLDEREQWTSKKLKNQAGVLLIANTVSNEAGDEVLKKAQGMGALDFDLYQDLPARILSTLRFIE